MAQSLVNKRRNIATNAVIHATQLWDHLQALKGLALERAQAGNFEQTDFDDTDLEHLTPFMIGSLLDTIIPGIAGYVEDSANPARRDILLQVRR